MPPPSAPLSLLVVDDDDDFRESLVSLLTHLRNDVVSAPDLAGARAFLAARSFDAVLADQELPDGKGVDLIDDPHKPPGTEIVVITGHASVYAAVEALRRGAADYLTKPTDPQLLQATLSRLTRVRSLQKEVQGLR